MKRIYSIKILFLTGVLILLFTNSRSQSLANYSAVRNTGLSYSSISASGNSFSSWRSSAASSYDDNRSDLTNIGFDFWYNGTRYTHFCVSTNGFIDFSSSANDGGSLANAYGYDNTTFSNSTPSLSTLSAIAPFYDDLTVPGSGTISIGNNIKYLLSGSAPNRTLTIEWINMQYSTNNTPNLNFQVQLVEASGKIFINYGVMSAGTELFSYSMGLNGQTLSATPTASQLKELQAANGVTFSNAVQNNLSAMPAANSQYVFTPPVPTAVSGSLTFSGIGQTAMTLNWTDWAINEVGYAIYNSTDGVNYNFVSQTAVNAITSNITGLLPATTYYWRLYAVTEGCLSSAITGTQTTTAAGNKISTSSGNWGSASTWSPSGVPSSADNVTIANGHSIAFNVDGGCNSLIVGQGTSGVLTFDQGGSVRTLSVNGNITINGSAVFSVQTNSNKTHTIVLNGNLINNGTLNLASDFNSFINLVFSKNGNQTISGTGPLSHFKNITLNMGNSINNILDVTSLNFTTDSNFLSLSNGTFKLSTPNAVNVIAFTGSASIPASAGVYLNSANATVSTHSNIVLYGNISVLNGTLNIGNAANLDLLSNGGTLTVSNGLINVAGKYYTSGINNLSYYNQSGGTFLVPAFGSTNTTTAPFHISGGGSQFTMSGGTIIIPREGGSGTQDLGFINTGSSGGSVTGGTLQIGNASTPAGQTISINSTFPVGNLLLNSSNATAKLNANSLNVINNITISSGTINSNNLNFTLGGSWNNNGGIFTPGTGIVTFSSTTAQSIFKSGGETFNHLNFIGSGVKTFSSPVTSLGNFSLTSGSSVDVSALNYSLTVKGNFLNSGIFNSRNGQVFLTGTTAQTVGGSSVTDFFDLSLTNSAGATVSSPENLKGTLTLSGGTFNANGNLTMVSTATATARIAQITGSGDIIGNVIVQRFAPGGTTGWALWGTPISSALTLQDWDDDIFISCPTCPDGSAAGFLSIYTYDETQVGKYDTAISYIPLNTIMDPIIPNKGYWVYLGDGQYTTNDITVDVTGTVRKFNNIIPINYTNHGSAVDDGWNLIHNPYPSPISWSALKGATSNIDNSIYVYNTDLNGGSGGFASYVNGVSSPAVGSGGVGDAIPMSQGFYVHSTGATALTAQESNKVSGNPTYLRTNNAQPNSILRITLSNNSFNDETVLYFQNGASNIFDTGYDSYKMRGQDPYAPSIALENGTDDFQINGIPPVTGNYTTSLKTLTGYADTYTLSANNFSSFPQGACINLYDKFTQITTNLKTSSYVFNLSDTTTVARFNLNITINPLNVVSSVSQPNCQQINNGQIIVAGANAGPWNYYWTLNGNAVKTSLNKSSADSLSGLTGGNYILEVNTAGLCDNNTSAFTINQQIAPTAQFVCADSLNLNVSAFMPFYNASVNSFSYQWNFGDNAGTSTAVSPLYNYQSAGVYTVNLISTSSTGCTDAVNKTVKITGSPVGISVNNINNTGLIVKTIGENEFILQQQFAETKTLNFKLFDASARLLKDYGNISSDLIELAVDLKNVSAGIYFMKIFSVNESGNYGMKVVKLPVSN